VWKAAFDMDMLIENKIKNEIKVYIY